MTSQRPRNQRCRPKKTRQRKSAKIKVSGKGKVTIPKKCKKGTYKVTVKAKGNNQYQPGSKTVTITVK